MRLNVPIYKQSKRQTCGPTALRMVLGYYGINKSENELAKLSKTIKNKDTKIGTRLLDLGITVAKMNFHVTTYSFMLKKQTKKMLSSKKKLIGFGGNYKFKQPSISDVIKFLKSRMPVIMAINSAVLFNHNKTDMGHFIVITGYDKGKFYYNDPWDGKKKTIKENELLFAWYNNVIESSGYLLAIKSK